MGKEKFRSHYHKSANPFKTKMQRSEKKTKMTAQKKEEKSKQKINNPRRKEKQLPFKKVTLRSRKNELWSCDSRDFKSKI